MLVLLCVLLAVVIGIPVGLCVVLCGRFLVAWVLAALAWWLFRHDL